MVIVRIIISDENIKRKLENNHWKQLIIYKLKKKGTPKLNRRIPNGTYGGVRGNKIRAFYSLLD